MEEKNKKMGKKALGLLLGLTVLTGTNPINADQGDASQNRTILKSPSNIKQTKVLGLALCLGSLATTCKGEFNDTAKPNALVISTKRDWNGSFSDNKTIVFYNMLKERYDVLFKEVATEKELYKAIKSIPQIELLIISGHGNRVSLNLGSRVLFSGEDGGAQYIISPALEKHLLDITDKELNKYLQKLDPKGVIFLDSCSTAEGGEQAENLANLVIMAANGRKVIAAKKDYGSNAISIKSVYPFDIRIIDPNTGEDVTYSNK